MMTNASNAMNSNDDTSTSVKCTVFEQRCSNAEELLKHSHSGSKQQQQHWYTCPHCYYSTTVMAFLIVHRRQHMFEKRYKCQYCPYSTNQSSRLIIHEKIHTGIKPSVPNVATSSTLRKMIQEFDHIRNAEENSSYSFATEKSPVTVKKWNNSEEGLYKHQTCYYSTNLRDQLKNHERTHTEVQNERIHAGERRYNCRHCSYSTPKKATLIDHERTHSGERPFKCQYCTYSAAVLKTLKVHIRTHTGEKPHKCRYCSYSSSDPTSRKYHERIHNGERPHKCRYCAYSSIRRQTLKYHERTHTGERPHKCPYCMFTAVRKTNLKVHERNHTGQRPYKCRYCSFSASQNYPVKRHEKIHCGKNAEYSDTFEPPRFSWI